MTKWTPSHIQALARLWRGHSASEIGKTIGMSRNAVIGKARRLGLKKRQQHDILLNFPQDFRIEEKKKPIRKVSFLDMKLDFRNPP